MTEARKVSGKTDDAHLDRGAQSPRQSRYVRGGGPRLDTDEWILLTHIFVSNGFRPLSPDHPDIQSVSPVLTRFAARRGASREGQTLRSAEGLSRRVQVLQRLERNIASPAPKAARSVYELYSNDPVAFASRAALLVDVWAVTDKAIGCLTVAPARGPAPFDGLLQVDRVSELMAIYLFVLDGPDAVVYPDPSDSARRFVKIGITNELPRRARELNQNFPPGLGLVWSLSHALRDLPPAHAYMIEQDLLSQLFGMGATLGGEFTAIDPEIARRLLEKHRVHAPALTSNGRAMAAVGWHSAQG